MPMKNRTMLSVPLRNRGFTLIELMVSVTIGLIVSAGAVGLIVAVDQANSEMIQSTRLTQELRALAVTIADDIKRARRVDDPISWVGQGVATSCPAAPTTPAQPCYPITPTVGNSSSCVTFGYTGTTTSAAIYDYHSIRRQVSGTVGSVVIDRLTFNPNVAAGTALPTTAAITACPITGATATTLNSPQVDITALAFNRVSANEIDLTITGKFLQGDTYTNSLTRTFTQPIFIRSLPPN